MNPNLLELAQGQLTGDVVQKYGGYLGESPDTTRRAFGSAVPAVLAGFVDHASRASSDPASSGFVRTLAEAQDGGSMLDNLPAMVSGGAETDGIVLKGEGMLGSLFGDRLPAIVDHVAGSSGVSNGVASKVLALSAPLMAANVGREAKARGLGGAGIVEMLAGQKGAVSSALAGGGLAGWFGEKESWTRRAAPPRVQESRVSPTGVPLGRRLGLPMPLILFAAVALAALLFLFRSRKPVTHTMPEPTKIGRVEAPRPPQVFGGGPVDSAEQLKRFFADPNAHVPERVVLEGVNFVPNSIALAPNAQTSIDSVAAALKQNPRAKVRVEAFTDATGDTANDQRLSVQRAYAVRDELANQGVDPARIAIAGYGAEHPIAPADTPEGRAKNSRIELVVTDR